MTSPSGTELEDEAGQKINSNASSRYSTDHPREWSLHANRRRDLIPLEARRSGRQATDFVVLCFPLNHCPFREKMYPQKQGRFKINHNSLFRVGCCI